MQYEFEIIDFHTHPFMTRGTNICWHKDYCDMSPENTKRDLMALGISKICGSVIGDPEGTVREDDPWLRTKACNDEALRLRELYGDFYIPGFHVHPDYVRESCEEIERMHHLGVHMLGELLPYLFCWEDYSSKGMSEILDVCEQYDMVVNFHPMNLDQMDTMVKNHPKVKLVCAHPGEYQEFMRNMERMRMSENYYLDLSGYGILRHGMLRHAIDEFGPERFLFGSDFPTCNPAMYIGGVYLDDLISYKEKELIFAGNAKRLLRLN